MSRRGGSSRPACAEPGCEDDAAFWAYRPDRDGDRWIPICERHGREIHPSVEIRAWLEAGYLKPVELARPEGPPPEPGDERGAEFRAEIDRLMGWTG